MTDLKSLCEKAAFTNVKTYIASGNVAFQSSKSEKQIKSILQNALMEYSGKPVDVMVRSAGELNSVLESNPFPSAEPAKTMVFFLDEAPDPNLISSVKGKGNEEIQLGLREIYIHYPEGIGRSKLKLPASLKATARNMNTVAKMLDLA